MGRRFYGVARDRDGKKYGGTFEAADEDEARRLLKAQGFKIISLEEVTSQETGAEDEASVRRNVVLSPAPHASDKKPARAKFREAGGRRPLGLWKPLAAAAVFLTVIPAAITFWSPGNPKGDPAAVVRRFVELEEGSRYEDQYRLFSDSLQKQEKDGRSYAARRRSEARASAGAKAVLEGMETVSRKKREARLEGLVRQGEALTFYRWDIRARQGEWKISSLEARRINQAPAPAPAAIAEEGPELSTVIPVNVLTEDINS